MNKDQERLISVKDLKISLKEKRDILKRNSNIIVM